MQLDENKLHIHIRAYGRKRFLGLSKFRLQAHTNTWVTEGTRIPIINEFLNLSLGDGTKIILKVKAIETHTMLRPPTLRGEIGNQYKTPASVTLYCYANKKTLLTLNGKQYWQCGIWKLEI